MKDNNFILKETFLNGCYEIETIVRNDSRGKFVKTFHVDSFNKFGLECDFKESYYSTSMKNVLRGLHFQLPPSDHAKLVYSIDGEVMDVILDLRINSKTYGKFCIVELSSEKSNMVYIPRGMAHGFYVRSEQATLVYNVTSVYDEKNDSGILWNSVDIPWPNNKPLLSDRDKSFVRFDKFVSPF